MLAAAFAVHQLRVVFGYGADSHSVLAAPGHEYLPLLAAGAAVFLAMAVLRWCLALVFTHAGRREYVERRRPSIARSWAGTAAALVALYLAQAGMESLLDPSHPIWAHGGWTVIPLAMAAAALVVLALRGADAAVEHVARRRAARPAPRRARAQKTRPHVTLRRPRPPALASHLSGRAPPLAA